MTLQEILDFRYTKEYQQNIFNSTEFTYKKTIEKEDDNQNSFGDFDSTDYKQIYNTFTIQGQSLTSLKGIENFKKLETLNIDGCDFKTLRHLKRVKTLSSITITNSNLTNLKHFKNLSNLQYLDLSNNLIKTLDGIDNIKKLNNFNISYNPLEEIEKIENLDYLEEFQFSETPVYNKIYPRSDDSFQMKYLKKISRGNQEFNF